MVSHSTFHRGLLFEKQLQLKFILLNLSKQQMSSPKFIPVLARAGLTAKGIVYCLMGAVAFMAAFRLGGQSESNTNKNSLLSLIQHQVAGQLLLALLIVGLLCYCIWRTVQCFTDTEKKGTNTKGLVVRSRYLLSGLVYFSFAVAAIKLLLRSGDSDNGDSNQKFIAELLSKPFGQYLVGLAAAVIAAVGIYQIVYGVRGKYKKHVSGLGLQSRRGAYLIKAGTIGYIARGIVWLIIAWLMLKAAIYTNSKAAGDTNEAFSFLHASYGSLVTGALGLGLVLYGVFSFIRARFERFNTNNFRRSSLQ